MVASRTSNLEFESATMQKEFQSLSLMHKKVEENLRRSLLKRLTTYKRRQKNIMRAEQRLEHSEMIWQVYQLIEIQGLKSQVCSNAMAIAYLASLMEVNCSNCFRVTVKTASDKSGEMT